MAAVKLRVVRPLEAVPSRRGQLDWARVLRITGVVLWWLLTWLWALTKAVVIVVGVLVGVTLMLMGFLAHFVGGPRR